MSENRCICCGAQIPEGSQVCPICQREYMKYDGQVTKDRKRRMIVQYIMNEWVIPLGLGAAFIVFLILVSRL